MKKVLLAFLVVLVIVVGLRWNSASFFLGNKPHCVHTGFLSDDYFSSIKTCIGQLVEQKYSAHALIAHLKNNFPVLSKITVAYRPAGMRVMMHAYKPVCCINDTCVLTAGNHLFPKNFFVHHSCTAHAHITVAQDYMTKTPELVPSLLGALPSDFHELYDLTLTNEHCVYLTDKKEHHFTIISSTTGKNMPNVLARCMSVKKNISERNGFDKGVKWVADTRFADYIVVYKT